MKLNCQILNPMAGPPDILNPQKTVLTDIFTKLDIILTRTAGVLKALQNGGYPFCDTVKFEFSGDTKVTRDFSMRMPQWCSCIEIRYNGEF